MTSPHFLILHVDSPAVSAAFYVELLERQPIEASPTFVLFALSPHLMLGLWSRHTVVPAAAAAIGGAELAITVEEPRAVDATHAAWSRGGVTIAADPDGHRLRVFAPAQG